MTDDVRLSVQSSFIVSLGTAHYLKRGIVPKRKDFLSKKLSYPTLRLIRMYLHNHVLSENFFHPTNFSSAGVAPGEG